MTSTVLDRETFRTLRPFSTNVFKLDLSSGDARDFEVPESQSSVWVKSTSPILIAGELAEGGYRVQPGQVLRIEALEDTAVTLSFYARTT